MPRTRVPSSVAVLTSILSIDQLYDTANLIRVSLGYRSDIEAYLRAVEHHLEDMLFIDRVMEMLFSEPGILKPLSNDRRKARFDVYVKFFGFMPSYRAIASRVSKDGRHSLTALAALFLPLPVKRYLIPSSHRFNMSDEDVDRELISLLNDIEMYKQTVRKVNEEYLIEKFPSIEDREKCRHMLLLPPASFKVYVDRRNEIDASSTSQYRPCYVNACGDVLYDRGTSNSRVYTIPDMQPLRDVLEILLTPSYIRQCMSIEHAYKALNSPLIKQVDNMWTELEPPKRNLQPFTGPYPPWVRPGTHLSYDKVMKLVVVTPADEDKHMQVVGYAITSKGSCGEVSEHDIDMASDLSKLVDGRSCRMYSMETGEDVE